MHTPLRSTFLRRHIPAANRHGLVVRGTTPSHEQRIARDLKALGMSRYGLGTPESRYLPQILHVNERIGGVVYGYHKDGFAMLVATNRRLIYLDNKPLFVNEDEINYFVVSGVKFSHSGFGSTVTVHTRVRDFRIRTLNQRCAKGFVAYIESRCLERKENAYDTTP